MLSITDSNNGNTKGRFETTEKVPFLSRLNVCLTLFCRLSATDGKKSLKEAHLNLFRRIPAWLSALNLPPGPLVLPECGHFEDRSLWLGPIHGIFLILHAWVRFSLACGTH